ncbi:MAG: hypothetical protein ACYS18_06000 [Planctomycetota bacterium]|jgi:hypothetical protein
MNFAKQYLTNIPSATLLMLVVIKTSLDVKLHLREHKLAIK